MTKENTKEETKEVETKVKLSNGDVLKLQGSIGMKRITDSVDLDMETSEKVYLLVRKLKDSLEAKALGDHINKIIKMYGKDGSLDSTHPEMAKLLEKDSGIEVERIKIDRKQVKISVADRIQTECVFDYV